MFLSKDKVRLFIQGKKSLFSLYSGTSNKLALEMFIGWASNLCLWSARIALLIPLLFCSYHCIQSIHLCCNSCPCLICLLLSITSTWLESFFFPPCLAVSFFAIYCCCWCFYHCDCRWRENLQSDILSLSVMAEPRPGARLNPGLWNSIWVSTCVLGTQIFGMSAVAFPGTLAWSCIDSKIKLVFKRCMAACRWEINLAYYNLPHSFSFLTAPPWYLCSSAPAYK